MGLVMVGLDYTTAGMDVREAFSPDAAALPGVLRSISGGEVDGCVLLSTCNRTELYLSHHGDAPPDGIALLCRALGRDADRYSRHFVERAERQATAHLMRVASGMESSVPGDDQIVTQVRNAVEIARKAETADPLLEALFRSAVAAGKKVKSWVAFSREGTSVAGRAVLAIERLLGDLRGRRALIIGNGVIGRLAAGELATRGCEVAVALRHLERRSGEIPTGCDGIDFENRYQALDGCDFVISATSSPRFSLTTGELAGLRSRPRLLVDLAIPRDIEPSASELENTVLWNIDDICPPGDNPAGAEQTALAEGIIAEEAKRLDLWRRNQRRNARDRTGAPDFPVFISLHGTTVLIAGGGKVAARRAEKLLGFGAAVRVASPSLSPEMEKLAGREGLTWIAEPYQIRHMDGITLAIAATDNREVNRRVGLDARERGVLVSVADRRQECTFYFPAIVRSDFFTAGVVSNNGDHVMVRQAAARLRQEMESIDEEYTSGQPGKPPGGDPGAAGYGRD